MEVFQTVSAFFVERLSADPTVELASVFAELCDLSGWTNATYLGSGIRGAPSGEDVLITTYHEDWVHRYSSQGYKHIDPVVSIGSRSLLALDWSEISDEDPDLKVFFGEAREMGIGRGGLTVAVRGAYGDSCLFSVNSNEEHRMWQLHKADILPDLTYLAHLIHDNVVSRCNPADVDDGPRLSRREQDVLRWAARGKTAWETGKILKIKEKTVSFYISNASAKLEVSTKTQAVAKAISERLLII